MLTGALTKISMFTGAYSVATKKLMLLEEARNTIFDEPMPNSKRCLTSDGAADLLSRANRMGLNEPAKQKP